MLINFEKLRFEDLELVLKWRTSPHVTEFMYTDIENNMEKQYEWFKKINQSSTEKHWIIAYKGEKIGLISLTNIDYKNKKSSSGFYIGELNYAILSSRILPYFLNYIFLQLQFNKIYIEVMSHNKNMLKMDLHYGFRHVGTMKQHIFKNDKFYDVEILELLRSTWLDDFQKYHKFKAVVKDEGNIE